MRKIVISILSLALLFSLTLMSPAVADDSNVNEGIESESLEKIPSPDQIRNYKVMKNENGTLYGVRIQYINSNAGENANEKAKINASVNSAVRASSTQLEKIPSPDQIKYFKVMKNENGALYGVRLENTEKKEEKMEKIMEKIAAPQFINRYEDIIQKGNALWGYLKDEFKKLTNKNENQEREQVKRRVITSDIKTCVAEVVDNKDEALKNALSTSNTDILSLIDTRNTCQKTAIESETDQLANLNACAESFQKSHKEIVNNLKNLQKEIWTSYKESMKDCLPESDVSDELLLIEDGGSDLLE